MQDIGFVHANWDDYGFDPFENQIFKRILRRGLCRESLVSMAKSCLMSLAKVRQAVRTLRAANVLTAIEEEGKSTTYSINPIESWAERDRLPQIRKTIKGETPTKSDTPIGFGTTPLSDLVGVPLSDLVPEVIPIEVIPKKFSFSTNSQGSSAVSDEDAIEEDSTKREEVIQPPLVEMNDSPEKQEADRPCKPNRRSTASEFDDKAFEEFWEAVPLKANKKTARDKFKRVKGISFDRFMECYRSALAKYQKRNPNTWQYFKRPDAWINQQCWLDELETETVATTSTSGDPNQISTPAARDEFYEWLSLAQEQGVIAGYTLEDDRPVVVSKIGRPIQWSQAKRLYPLSRLQQNASSLPLLQEAS